LLLFFSSDRFVDHVIKQNVHEMVAKAREESPVLAALEQSGQIKIVGATYDLATGQVTLVE
jgi:carbonic anhydrase